VDPPHAEYPARRAFVCRAARLIAGPSISGSRFAFWEAGCTDRPVLRANLRGGLGSLAAEIVEGGCDLEGAVGRLVDDVEL